MTEQHKRYGAAKYTRKGGIPLSEPAIAALKQALQDPNILILEDGTVWRRIGKTDKNGAAMVPIRMSEESTTTKSGKSKRYTPISAQYLVYAKFAGEIPNGWVTFKDGDPENRAFSNLQVTDTPFAGRRTRKSRGSLSFDEEREIIQMYNEGKNIKQIASLKETTIKVVKEVLERQNGKKDQIG